MTAEEEAEGEEGWTCVACTLNNHPTAKKCTACNGKRPEDYVVPPEHLIKEKEQEMLDEEKLEVEMKKLQIAQMISIIGVTLLPNPEPFQCPLCAGDVVKGKK